MKKLAKITITNLGSVEKATDIPFFLFNMFNDYNIIPIKQPLRGLIAAFLTIIRAKDTYKILKHSVSPLKQITKKQAEKLNKHSKLPVVANFVYTKPFLKKNSCTIAMFNFFSFTTYGKIIKSSHKVSPPFCLYPEFFDLVLYRISSIFDKCDEKKAILLSAHSLPTKLLKKTKDPYKHDLEVFTKFLRKRLKLPVYLSFQSKLGPIEWLEPSTETMIRNLKNYYNCLIVFPISFTTENTETVYELDKVYKNVAKSLDINLIRLHCFNDDNDFIELLKEVLKDLTRFCLKTPQIC